MDKKVGVMPLLDPFRDHHRPFGEVGFVVENVVCPHVAQKGPGCGCIKPNRKNRFPLLCITNAGFVGANFVEPACVENDPIDAAVPKEFEEHAFFPALIVVIGVANFDGIVKVRG